MEYELSISWFMDDGYNGPIATDGKSVRRIPEVGAFGGNPRLL